MDPDLVRQAASVEGYEARFITQTAKYGRQLLVLWGPQADLARDPRWGRSEEVYGEDPFFNGTIVTPSELRDQARFDSDPTSPILAISPR